MLIADYWAHLFPSEPTCDSYISAENAIACGRGMGVDECQRGHQRLNLLIDAIYERIGKLPTDSDESKVLHTIPEYIWLISPFVNTDEHWDNSRSLRENLPYFDSFLEEHPSLPEHAHAEIRQWLDLAKGELNSRIDQLERSQKNSRTDLEANVRQYEPPGGRTPTVWLWGLLAVVALVVVWYAF